MQNLKSNARRRILKNVLLAGALAPAVFPHSSEAALIKLTEDDPTAKALGYHESAVKVDQKAFPTFKENQKCGNCVQLQAGSGEERGCNLFPGKSVSIDGWCKVWVQKP
jgi:High potential iron-sulfur protein